MRTLYTKLHDEDYEYIKQIAETNTRDELKTLITDLKKETYHDYKGNMGLIETLERTLDVKAAIESRDNFRNGICTLEKVYWSPFERVDEAEEAAYLNLVDAYYDI